MGKGEFIIFIIFIIVVSWYLLIDILPQLNLQMLKILNPKNYGK